MLPIPEKDWKLFRQLQSELTAKACELIFKQVNDIASAREGNEHQSYLNLYDLVKTEDAKIAEMFNNPTRNNVKLKIVLMKKNDVLSDKQLQMFSEETQSFVNRLLSLS